MVYELDMYTLYLEANLHFYYMYIASYFLFTCTPTWKTIISLTAPDLINNLLRTIIEILSTTTRLKNKATELYATE